MKTLFILTIIFILCLSSFAQEKIKPILQLIEKNNKTLVTLKAETEATVTGNLTDLLPDNPEVEYSHLWGTPSAIGNRHDFSVLQTFDFPTAYMYRSQIAVLKNENALMDYELKRNLIFHNVRKLLAELEYYNALIEVYNQRLKHAERMVFNYQQRFESGDANVLDINKAKVNRLNLIKKIERFLIERDYLNTELEMLNGGEAIQYDTNELELPVLTKNFNVWLDNAEIENSMLQSLQQESSIAGKQIQLNRALSMPKIHAGYMSEKIVGEHFQGISAGITIPLWENKNKVKYARARADAISLRISEFRFKFYSEMNNLYNKALSLQQSTRDFEEELGAVDNRQLLEKALDAGQVSLSEYLLELSVYYESIDNLMELKRDALLAYYDLFRYGMNE